MAPHISKAEAEAFRTRWALVNARQRDLLRQMSLEEKLRQVAILMASAKALGWEHKLAEGDAEVRDRWARLRKAFHV